MLSRDTKQCLGGRKSQEYAGIKNIKFREGVFRGQISKMMSVKIIAWDTDYHLTPSGGHCNTGVTQETGMGEIGAFLKNHDVQKGMCCEVVLT